MALKIETFSNQKGGFPFFKAAGHPAAAAAARALVGGLTGRVAVYDPHGFAAAFAELHDLGDADIRHVFVQDIETLGQTVLGRTTEPVTALAEAAVDTLLVVAFDAERLVSHIAHLVPDGATVVSLDDMRLADDRLTNSRYYLDPMNFATNFAFFRDEDGQHTRLVSANYWHGYGARGVKLWLTLLDGDGEPLAQWDMALDDAVGQVSIDSQEVRERFGLGPFTGQLFVHAIGVKGHDVVKYALDTYGDDATALSCTHDANAWPADFYAGLPAPDDGETVLLWVQNSHPCPIPPGAVGLNLMGDDDIAWLDDGLPAFGSTAIDVARLLPKARWPQQIEVQAGKHMVRPRYEVIAGARRRVAHVNVERVDLKPDPKLAELSNLLGKGFVLPAPVLPPKTFASELLPTPMATTQRTLPIAVTVYDAQGGEVARHSFGELARSDCPAVGLDHLLNGHDLAGGFGHMELTYDFGAGQDADGWLHALFRYRHRGSGHAAETSFGAHMFNGVMVYKGEPQSYAGPAPGLSTRLFLRLGGAGGPPETDTLCHLIYPASTPWHQASATQLALYDGSGQAVATEDVAIACGGSLLWRSNDMFSDQARARAGANGYVMIRDTTCRLFGYHGVITAADAFSFDHMFGF